MNPKLHPAAGAIALTAGLGSAGQFAANATGASGDAAAKLWIGMAVCLLIAVIFGLIWWRTRPAEVSGGSKFATIHHAESAAAMQVTDSPETQAAATAGATSPVAQVQDSPGAIVQQIGRDQHNYLAGAISEPEPKAKS